MKRRLRYAWAEWVAGPTLLALLATPAIASAAGSTEPLQAAATPRCWYVVPETVVPVNLHEVAVVSSAAGDPALRQITFLQTRRPVKVITQFVVEPDRLDELLDIVARRRSDCAHHSSR